MLFSSLTFVLLHLLVLGAYWAARTQGVRLAILALGSLVFYGWFYWPGLFFIGAAIAVNYTLALQIERTGSRRWLVAGVTLNLLNLAYFKYVNFFAQSLADLLQFAQLDLPIPVPNYWLPLGISFITFQKIAYLVDVYQKKTQAERNPLVFTCFAAFYGQLIAGPIVRSNEFLPQLKSMRTFSGEQMQLGFFYFIAGLLLKVTVADSLAQFVEYGFANIDTLSTGLAWATIYAFAIQILCDFWGYSTIALGTAFMLGMKLPVNFDAPYSSTSLQEFWRRWHITLSSWLRDYLYIPLGGNRNGRTYRNLIATMTLGGLWHGASWNFVLWGFLHGVWLAAERRVAAGKIRAAKPGFWVSLFKKLMVFHGVCLLWVFFRAQTFGEALRYFERLLLPPYDLTSGIPPVLLNFLILFALFGRWFGQYLVGDGFVKLSLTRQLALTTAVLLLLLGYAQARLDFIYFVF